MKSKEEFNREKEKAAKLKELRNELEQEIEERLVSEQAAAGPDMGGTVSRAEPVATPENLRQVLEAILYASGKPVTVQELKKVIRGFSARDIEEGFRALQADYAAANRAYEVLEIAGGFELATKKEYAPWMIKLELQKKIRQATQSALETLAILAYKQPITRAEIEELRGVDSSGVLTTLIERGFIKIVGKKEVLGRPFLYGTTEKFLEHFGLNTLKDLPNIEEIKTLVETAVKKDELLGRPQIVDIPPEMPQNQAPENAGPDPEPAPEEKNLGTETST
ncbi:MAG: SMC-Scp complex subunit ScpB [Candidatus Omnitrophota bacterium]